jgi:hypothetical protein
MQNISEMLTTQLKEQKKYLEVCMQDCLVYKANILELENAIRKLQAD